MSLKYLNGNIIENIAHNTNREQLPNDVYDISQIIKPIMTWKHIISNTTKKERCSLDKTLTDGTSRWSLANQSKENTLTDGTSLK